MSINRYDILKNISEEQIYLRYCGTFTTKHKIKSPFRRDTNPSFSFFKGSSNIMWKDLANGDSGDVFKFVSRILNNVPFHEVYSQINNDFNLNLHSEFREPYDKSKTSFNNSSKTKIKRKIEVEDKPFNQIELQIWQSYGIGKPFLDMYHIGAAKQVFLDGNVTHITSNLSPVFYFYFPKTHSYKIYRPFAFTEKKKWLSNTNSNDDVQGLEQCQFGKRRIKLLILTKAMKEVVFYRTFGIDAIAIQGENHYYSEKLMMFLKANCDNIISIYDRDKAGIRGANWLYLNYGIPGLLTPKEYNRKNVTDLYLTHPKQTFEFIKNIIKVYKNGN